VKRSLIANGEQVGDNSGSNIISELEYIGTGNGFVNRSGISPLANSEPDILVSLAYYYAA